MRVLLIVLVALAMPSVGQAQKEKRLTITVHVIHASKHGNQVDARLESLKKDLSVFGFTTYELITVASHQVGVGEKFEVALPGGRKLEITPKTRTREKVRFQAKIDGLLNTIYGIDSGGTLIIGGPKHEDGVLVIAITHGDPAAE